MQTQTVQAGHSPLGSCLSSSVYLIHSGLAGFAAQQEQVTKDL